MKKRIRDEIKRWSLPACYGLIAITYLVTFWSLHSEIPPERFNPEIPAMSFDELWHARKAMFDQAEAATKPDEIFAVRKRLQLLTQVAARGSNEATDMIERSRFNTMASALMQYNPSNVADTFARKFGRHTMMKTMEGDARTYATVGELTVRGPTNYAWLKNLLLLWGLLIPFGSMVLSILVAQSPIHNLRLEWLSLYRIPAHALVLPYALFVYPNGDVRDQTIRAMRSIRCLLSAFMTFGGFGALKALAQNAPSNPEPKQVMSGQLDLRMRGTAGSPNQQHQFIRLTLKPNLFGKAWVADLIPARTGKATAFRVAAGPEILKGFGFHVYVTPSLTLSGKSTTTGEGAQVYWGRPPTARVPKLAVAAPVNELYQEFKAGAVDHGWKHNHQALVSLTHRLYLGEETFVAKPFGKAASGYFGPTVGYTLDTEKKLTLEAGALRTLSGDWMYRARVLVNFSLSFGH